ncbi:hypothetical protein [Glycomyces sp. NPDC048151]|uniref:DUF7507 domain-containing protein n=1 Tax=Glycomyces sp. NPDC048151 TaxID=3364002 RepID=UPI003721D0CD
MPIPAAALGFPGEAGAVEVLDSAAPEPVQDTYKFGFAASTGLFTDVHLIGGLTVRSERPLPLLDLEKTADTSRTYRPGDTVTYTYTATNTTGVPVTDLVIADDLVADVPCESTTLAPAGEPGDRITRTGVYTVTEEDGRHRSVTNTATVTGSNGTIDSATATVTITTEPGGTAPPPDTLTDPGASPLSTDRLTETGTPTAPIAIATALLILGAATVAWARIKHSKAE